MRARLNTGMTRPKSFDNIAEKSLSGPAMPGPSRLEQRRRRRTEEAAE